MNTGENIKKYRKEKKITQKQLAELIDKNIRTIQKYESGEIEVPLENALKISEILQIPVKDIYNPKDEEINKILARATIEEFMNYNDLNAKEFMELIKDNPSLVDDFEKPEAIKDFITDEDFNSKMGDLKAFSRIESVLKAYNIHFAFNTDKRAIILVDKNDHFSNDISVEYFKSFIFKLNELIENEIEYFKIIQALNRANEIEVKKNNK